MLEGLFAHLSAVVEQPDDDSLRVDVLAFVKDGAAVLAPADIRSALPSLERRLRSKGLRVVDRPWVRVDPDRGELVVTEPELSVEPTVLDGIGDGSDPAVEPGRYPIVGWGFGVGRGQRGPISRALAVTLAGARLVDRASVPPQHALEALARVVARIRPVAVWSDHSDDLIPSLAALAG